MRAIQIDTYGGPDVVVQRDIPVPTPGPDEVLIRLHRSGINFMDVHTRQGKYAGSTTYPQKLPTTLGIEGAGVVEAMGADVTGIARGDRVGYCLSWGSYADYAVVPAWKVIPLPDALSFDLAVASMFHGLTAHYLANDVGRLGPGMTCLVHAASGGIGQLLVQMGVQLGATVYATTSSDAKCAVARRHGASVAMTYDDGGFADQVRELTDGAGVDVVFDPIGAPTLRDSFRATRKKGLVVAFGSVGGSVRDLDPIELGEAGSLFITRPRLADHLTDQATIRRRGKDVFGALLEGAISIEVGGRFAFNDVGAAHAKLEGRVNVGKPILMIADD